MDFRDIIVKESPGLCRCCLSEGCYKDLGSEYSWMNENEIYADMLLECFDISISQHNEGPNGPNRLICEVCITRLRDACNFKKQVLDSEKKFVDMVGRGEFRSKVLIYQAQMKAESEDVEMDNDAEVEYLEDDLDLGDDVPLKSYKKQEPTVSKDITVATLPLKTKRGRPKKAATAVKSEKKAKLSHAEEKPRSSKAVIKASSPSSAGNLQLRRNLIGLLTFILEDTTAMPFRWCANKYMCFFCCSTFIDSLKLKEHTKEEHQNPKLKNVLRNSIKNSTIKLDISEMACKTCPKPLKNLDEFLEHAAIAHDLTYIKEVSSQVFAFKLSDEGMFCQDCGQSFRFFGPLLKHAHRYHHKSSPFLCEICGRGFIKRANVDSHIKNAHSGTQNQCNKCEDVFPTLHTLKTHYERVHKRIKCPKCPETLDSRYLRKRHLALVHNVQTSQFHCDECPRMFTEKSKLVQHKSRIHLKEKTVTCEICGFKVFNNELLKRHMVRHDDSRPFECEICKKAFQRKKTLEFHRRIHTNDKRYVCKDCGKAFVQVTSLKLHIRVHHSTINDSSKWN